jgi:hypothetical protein
MNVRPQLLAALTALLALIPVAFYANGQATIAAVALVNVLIVAGSLYYMFSPAEGGDGASAH